MIKMTLAKGAVAGLLGGALHLGYSTPLQQNLGAGRESASEAHLLDENGNSPNVAASLIGGYRTEEARSLYRTLRKEAAEVAARHAYLRQAMDVHEGIACTIVASPFFSMMAESSGDVQFRQWHAEALTEAVQAAFSVGVFAHCEISANPTRVHIRKCLDEKVAMTFLHKHGQGGTLTMHSHVFFPLACNLGRPHPGLLSARHAMDGWRYVFGHYIRGCSERLCNAFDVQEPALDETVVAYLKQCGVTVQDVADYFFNEPLYAAE